MDGPQTRCDLVTSDSVFAIKRNSTNPARVNETTTLVIRDKATSWIAEYPAKRKSTEDIMEAVVHFKGSETISAGTQTGHLSYIACAASSEFGTTCLTRTALR